MDEELVRRMEQVAYIQAMTVAALAVIEGMRALNMQREHRGEAMGYIDDDFNKVIEEFELNPTLIAERLGVPE